MKETAYLLVHGFGGTVSELDYLAEYLRAKGLDVHTVSLPGHGGTRKEFKQSTHTAWIDHVRETVDALKAEYRHIIYLGFSMGGLLGVQCGDIPEIQKFVLINTPIYVWNLKIIGKNIFRDIRHRQFHHWSYYRKSASKIPLKSMIEFLKIRSKSKKRIGAITKPTLLIQCKDDETVRYKSATYIQSKLSDQAVLRYYDGGCHGVFTKADPLRDLICSDIFSFLKECTNNVETY